METIEPQPACEGHAELDGWTAVLITRERRPWLTTAARKKVQVFLEQQLEKFGGRLCHVGGKADFLTIGFEVQVGRDGDQVAQDLARELEDFIAEQTRIRIEDIYPAKPFWADKRIIFNSLEIPFQAVHQYVHLGAAS